MVGNCQHHIQYYLSKTREPVFKNKITNKQINLTDYINYELLFTQLGTENVTYSKNTIWVHKHTAH